MNRAALLASLVAALAVTAGTAVPAATPDATGSPSSIASQTATQPGSRSAIDELVPASAPHVRAGTAADDRASRLTLGTEPDAAGYATPTADLATTLAMGHAEFELQLATLTVKQRLSLIESESARRAILKQRLAAIEARIRALRRTERRAVRAYAAGEASLRSLARTLARVRSTAVALDATLVDLYEQTSSDEIRGRIRALQARLETFIGPVRAYLQRAITARETDAPRVAVAVTEDGYVLGVVDGNRYLREALRFDNRDLDGDRILVDSSEIFQRLTELYPELDREGVALGPLFPYTTWGKLIRASIEYPYGTATAYVGAASAEVFYEERQIDLAELPTHVTINTTENGLQLVVNRSFDNGPTRVRVVDARTGEPIDATVVVDGDRVGRTGVDGTLWFVEPPGSYAIVVRAGNVTVSATVPDGDPGGATAPNGTVPESDAELRPPASRSSQFPDHRSRRPSVGPDQIERTWPDQVVRTHPLLSVTRRGPCCP